MPYYNQEFRSSDLNSPPLTGQSGSSLVVLSACLVNGYAFTVSITGITRSGSTATATVSATDGLKLKTGQILTVAGAGQSDYNITATITVASTTTFTYTVANSPTTPATGTITASSKLPITSITRGGTGNLTATAVLANINTTLIPGDKITIEGAAQSPYNGAHTILTLTNSGSATTITYAMSSDPGASASGTLTYYKSGLQWAHAVAGGTNAQSYVSQATVGANAESYTPRPLQVVDNAATAGGAKEAQLWAYESITSDQNGTARWPTTAQLTNGMCLRKSTSADTVVRAWTLFGDEKSFDFEPQPEVTTDQGNGYGFYFGYFPSEKSGDAYNTILLGHSTFNNVNVGTVQGNHGLAPFSVTPAAGVGYVPRIYNQAGTSAQAALVGAVNAATISAMGGVAYITYPNPSNGALYTQRVRIVDGAGSLRGRLPGIHALLHSTPLTQFDISTNNNGLPGVTLRALNVNTGNNVQGQFMYDVFGPWD